MLTSHQMVQEDNWIAPAEANNLKNPLFGSLKATEKGRKIYLILCWSCHGVTGKGDGPAAAGLVPAPTDYTDDKAQQQTDGSIFWKITNGRGTMASYRTILSDDQRWMLVNYIRELAKESNNSALKTD